MDDDAAVVVVPFVARLGVVMRSTAFDAWFPAADVLDDA